MKSEYRIRYMQETGHGPLYGTFAFKEIILESTTRGGARREYAAWKKKNLQLTDIFVPELIEINTLDN
ncbi:MAG: hypothetical protein Q8P76_03060 [bacterium]|nr:hypothetical protein [bacterium]